LTRQIGALIGSGQSHQGSLKRTKQGKTPVKKTPKSVRNMLKFIV
jgi:hypothetical protein